MTTIDESHPTSMLAACGYAQDDIDARLAQVWHEIFEGPDKFYWESDDGLAYVMDTGNDVDFSNMPKGWKTTKLSNCKRISARKSWMVQAIAI